MKIYIPNFSLEKSISLMFFLGLFFLPFNSFEGISFLGEYKKDPSTIFFLTGFLLLCLKAIIKGKLKIPFNNLFFQIFILFVAWCLVSVLLNFFEISQNNLKGIKGWVRVIKQTASLLISGFVFLLFYYNVLSKYSLENIFYKIRKTFLYSFIVVSLYAFFETLIVKLHFGSLLPVFELFDYFPFTNPSIDTHLHRISSVTFEPPALATYLLLISGWMFSYILTEKGLKRFIPTVLVLVLTLLTGSRSALAFVFVQFLAIIILLLLKGQFRKPIIIFFKYSSIVVLLILLFKGRSLSTYIYEKATSFSVSEGEHRVSNKSRLGIQYTSLLVFLESPIYGKGIGQQAYRARYLYPDWATENNWEFRLQYFNEDYKEFPPGFNFYTRLLAETGLIGFFIFMLLIAVAIYSSYLIYKKNTKDSILVIVVLISLIGFVLNWFKMDSFRPFGFWINLAILMHITKKYKLIYKK